MSPLHLVSKIQCKYKWLLLHPSNIATVSKQMLTLHNKKQVLRAQTSREQFKWSSLIIRWLSQLTYGSRQWLVLSGQQEEVMAWTKATLTWWQTNLVWGVTQVLHNHMYFLPQKHSPSLSQESSQTYQQSRFKVTFKVFTLLLGVL